MLKRFDVHICESKSRIEKKIVLKVLHKL